MGLLDSILNFGSTAATNRANERIQNSINETNTANVNATNEANRQIAEATNKANVEMNEANNAANRELAELQNAWNLEQWQRENEYNSPAAQMERLISAGLNPAAAAAAVTNGNAASLQSAPLANQVPSHIDPYQLQAAGRVIRTKDDAGIIALLDERFLQAGYKKMFPAEWKHVKSVGISEMYLYAKNFWEEL